MSIWPLYPVVYEINTWVWLNGLKNQKKSPITLGNVPQAELERLAEYGFDAIWLMGVWQRSDKTCQLDRSDHQKSVWYRQALIDYSVEDVVGSPFAIYDYNVAARFGGNAELASLRKRLKKLGMRLILDFVPNHLASDHPWTTTNPEYLIQGDQATLSEHPDRYFFTSSNSHSTVFAHGRDRYYIWPDTVQVDYRNPAARHAMTEILLSVAEHCDGVRCDMAMLLIRNIFCEIWGGEFILYKSEKEFWSEAICKVKEANPHFLMIAEAYWDLEYILQQQGFDYIYDKRLYDRLKDGKIAPIRDHLRNTNTDFQNHLVRFIENHDEERAIKTFGEDRSIAAALMILTLPGMRLLHEGQLEGRGLRLPVQLGRRSDESPKAKIELFYHQVLSIRHKDQVLLNGQWEWLEILPSRYDPRTICPLVAYHWWLGESHKIVIINLTSDSATGLLQLHEKNLPDLTANAVYLHKMLGNTDYIQDYQRISFDGVDVKLDGYGYCIFDICHLI